MQGQQRTRSCDCFTEEYDLSEAYTCWFDHRLYILFSMQLIHILVFMLCATIADMYVYVVMCIYIVFHSGKED